MSADPTSVLDSLGPARRFADPNAPLEARMMAARGALPLPPPQVATVLYAASTMYPPKLMQGILDKALQTSADSYAEESPPEEQAHNAQEYRGDRPSQI